MKLWILHGRKELEVSEIVVLDVEHMLLSKLMLVEGDRLKAISLKSQFRHNFFGYFTSNNSNVLISLEIVKKYFFNSTHVKLWSFQGRSCRFPKLLCWMLLSKLTLVAGYRLKAISLKSQFCHYLLGMLYVFLKVALVNSK